MAEITRPAKADYHPYYERYVNLVPIGDPLVLLRHQLDCLLKVLALIDEEQSDFRYQLNKWCIKELLGHMVDTERHFAFRAFSFARNDPTPLPGMDPDMWVAIANFSDRPFLSLVDEYEAVRKATLTLYRGFDSEMLGRRGVADGNKLSVRAILYIIAGHERHHVKVLGERYLDEEYLEDFFS